MVFKIDFEDDCVVRWKKTSDGVVRTVDRSYRPTIYAITPDWSAFKRSLNNEPMSLRRRSSSGKLDFESHKEMYCVLPSAPFIE